MRHRQGQLQSDLIGAPAFTAPDEFNLPSSSSMAAFGFMDAAASASQAAVSIPAESLAIRTPRHAGVIFEPHAAAAAAADSISDLLLQLGGKRQQSIATLANLSDAADQQDNHGPAALAAIVAAAQHLLQTEQLAPMHGLLDLGIIIEVCLNPHFPPPVGPSPEQCMSMAPDAYACVICH